MVNTVGFRKAAVLETLAKAAGVEFKPMILNGSSMSPVPNCFWAIVNGVYVILDLHADDGFDEAALDYALGTGATQAVIDELRMEVNKV